MPTPAHVACHIGGVGLTIGLGPGLFTGALDLLTDLKISSCHVILCSKVRSCFEIALAVLFPSELLGSSSMTNCYYLKHFFIYLAALGLCAARGISSLSMQTLSCGMRGIDP